MRRPTLPLPSSGRPRRRRTAQLGAAAAIAVLLGIAGCSGSSTSGDAAVGQSAGDARVDEAAPAVPPVEDSAGQAGADADPGAEGQKGLPAPLPGELQQRAIVRTAALSVEAENVDAAADAVLALATTYNGRVDGDLRHDTEERRTAQIVLRVPPEDLDTVIAAIVDLGEEINREIRGEDVTTVKADVDARVTSLTASVARLQELMSKSGSVADLVALESALAYREQELASLQAQQRALNDQISLATLTVSLSAPGRAVEEAGPTGFGEAVETGWNGLLTGLGWIVAAIGYALPVAVPVALLIAIPLVIRRRRRRTTQTPPEPPAPTAPAVSQPQPDPQPAAT